MQQAEFWNKIAPKYAAKPVPDERAYQHKLALSQHYLRPDMEVLEFGCGTGSTALLHAPQVKHYTATDISSSMIEIAQNKPNQPPNLDFQVASLQDFSDHKGHYDAILGLSILHLIEDYQGTIELAYQLLKPGGVLITSTGCLKEGMFLIKLILPIMQALNKAPYVNVFSRDELEAAMTQSGFTIAERWSSPKSKETYFLIAQKPA